MFTSLAECEAVWRSAAEHCTCFAFQCFEWQAAWQATIGAAENVVPYIVLCSDPAGRTLMLLPLGIYRQHGLRVLRFLGGVVSDYNAPVIEPGFAAQLGAGEIAKLWARIVSLLPKVDLVWLWRMPETIEGLRNPLIMLPGAEHSEDSFAATLPSSIAAFRAAHTANWSDTRRRRRRLAEAGRVEFDTPQTLAAKLEVLRVLGRLKSQHWRRMRSRDLFAEPGYFSFYEMLSTTAFTTVQVHVSCLRVDERIVAAHWGLVFRGRFYYLITAYAAEWSRYSVGRLLLDDLVEWCIAQPGIGLFDLTVGAEPYKRAWTDRSLALYELIAPYSMRGRMYLAGRRLRDRIKRYRRLRNLVRRLKGRQAI